MKSLYVAAIAALSLLWACGNKNENVDTPTDAPRPVAVEKADSSSQAWKAGASDAREMLSSCTGNEQLHDALLEINARRTFIRSTRGDRDADNYVAGFTATVTELNDTLAAVLF